MLKKGTLQATILLLLITFSISYAQNHYSHSIVKVYTVQDNPSYNNPWNTTGPESINGSGVVISGNRILTSAHVVNNNTFIQVRLHGSARRYEAKVVAISHEADLAVLTMNDPTFFHGVKPLEIGDLPEIQERVVVCGFPIGGDTLSMTAGVVSRIEHRTYVHSFFRLLAIQIDAAINPGNSGGPALSEDGRILGIAMQGIKDANNIGYLVPAPVINQFLADLGDGRKDGIPSLGVLTQGLENPFLREKNHMLEETTGCLVTMVVPGSAAEGYLKNGDILFKLNGFVIADDQTIEFRDQERTSFLYGIELLQIGDVVEVELLRDGRRRKVSLPLMKPMGNDSLVIMNYGRSPEYLIYGGLVFNPLTINYLQCWGEDWFSDAPNEMLSFLSRNWKTEEGQQIIILNKVLPYEINIGYHDIGDEIVVSVNDHIPRNMKEFATILEHANTDFVDIVLANNDRVVFKRQEVEATATNIFERYKIPRP